MRTENWSGSECEGIWKCKGADEGGYDLLQETAPTLGVTEMLMKVGFFLMYTTYTSFQILPPGIIVFGDAKASWQNISFSSYSFIYFFICVLFCFVLFYLLN